MKHLIVSALVLASALCAQKPSMESKRTVRGELTERDLVVLDALSEHCFRCHGPEKQKSGLRLDEEDGLLSVIEPGDPALSELVRRLLLPKTNDEAMPPPPEGEMQTEQAGFSRDETWATIDWIRDGAKTERILEELAKRRVKQERDDTAARLLSEKLGARLWNVAGGIGVDFRFGRRELDAETANALVVLANGLTELNFAGRRPTKDFLDALPDLPQLVVLRAERSGMGDASLAAILSTTPMLREANLHSTGAGSATLKAALALRSLKRVVAFDTEIDLDAVFEARKTRRDLEWVLDDRHPKEVFPGGGPRHLLIADAATDRLFLLRERALTHYDDVASWPIRKVAALDETNGHYFAKLTDGTIRRLARLGEGWVWLPSDGPSDYDTRPLDADMIERIWGDRPKELQEDLPRSFVRLGMNRILVSQQTKTGPALLEFDQRGTKLWSLLDPKRFPAGARAALVLNGDPRR